MGLKKLVLALGIILILIGSVTMVYRSFPYNTKENVVALGPLQMQATEQKNVYIDPVLSGLSIVAGLLLVLVAKNIIK